ncbi:unnamed protein product, partial [Darwinula stevensoni]
IKPSLEGEGPAAFYIAGSHDGSRPGICYVNTTDYKSQPKFEMVALALHEGNPGHHLQTTHLLEMEGLPAFRRFLEDRHYGIMPSRFTFYTAYIEGWGLYSERLGDDLHLYDDPYMKFGMLSMDALRASRLVVDTGLHAFDWAPEKAVNFMLAHTAASKRTC